MSSAFGLGPLPGTSIAEACDVVRSETGVLPHLPELPERGAASGLIGRGATLLEGLQAEPGPRAWQLTTRPQLATHRALDRLEADLDECESAWGTSVPRVKVQAPGPWTLAAALELPNGHRAITDPGALRDLTEALAGGLLAHVREVARRFSADVTVQLDEPALAAVHSGSLRGTTDFEVIPAVAEADLAQRLRQVSEAVADAAEAVWLDLADVTPLWQVAREAGTDAVLVNTVRLRGTQQLDAVGHAIAGGAQVHLSVDGAGEPRAEAIRLARLFDELGLPREMLTGVSVFPLPTWQGRGRPIIEAAHAYALATEVAGMLERDAGDL